MLFKDFHKRYTFFSRKTIDLLNVDDNLLHCFRYIYDIVLLSAEIQKNKTLYAQLKNIFAIRDKLNRYCI